MSLVCWGVLKETDKYHLWSKSPDVRSERSPINNCKSSIRWNYVLSSTTFSEQGQLPVSAVLRNLDPNQKRSDLKWMMGRFSVFSTMDRALVWPRPLSGCVHGFKSWSSVSRVSFWVGWVFCVFQEKCLSVLKKIMCFFSQRKPQLSRRMQMSPQHPQTASGGALRKTEGEKWNNNKGIMARSATLWPGHTARNRAFSPRVETQLRDYH